MYLLGYDIGSSSVKASLVNAETGKCVSSAFFPKTEAAIMAARPGWAEQDPQNWWENLKLSTQAVMAGSGIGPDGIAAIGISYQMHGLVCVDKGVPPPAPQYPTAIRPHVAVFSILSPHILSASHLPARNSHKIPDR